MNEKKNEKITKLETENGQKRQIIKTAHFIVLPHTIFH